MPGRDRADLGAEGVHPEHVRRLAPDVLLAHEHHARQAEQRARRRRRDAVLAGAGLGDHPGLAQPPGQQGLAERVVDLVGAGVGEVLALEVEPDLRDLRGASLPGRATAAPPRPARRRRGDRRGTAGSGGRRSGRGGRRARPRTADRGGPPRTRPRAAPAPRPASRARTARRSRAPCPTGPRRRPRAGRRGRASGRTATLGRWRRASRARFVNTATRRGSLCGRRPSSRGASVPEATSTPTAGIASSASATLPACRPPASVTGTSRATAAARPASTRTPVPPGCGPPAVSSRMRVAPASR